MQPQQPVARRVLGALGGAHHQPSSRGTSQSFAARRHARAAHEDVEQLEADVVHHAPLGGRLAVVGSGRLARCCSETSAGSFASSTYRRPDGAQLARRSSDWLRWSATRRRRPPTTAGAARPVSTSTGPRCSEEYTASSARAYPLERPAVDAAVRHVRAALSLHACRAAQTVLLVEHLADLLCSAAPSLTVRPLQHRAGAWPPRVIAALSVAAPFLRRVSALWPSGRRRRLHGCASGRHSRLFHCARPGAGEVEPVGPRRPRTPTWLAPCAARGGEQEHLVVERAELILLNGARDDERSGRRCRRAARDAVVYGRQR